MGNLEIFIKVSGRTVAVVMLLLVVIAGAILTIAAKRHFDEYGAYIGRRWPADKPDDLAALSDEIGSEAEALLPCGGSTKDPEQASHILRARYGSREMLRRCVVVAFTPEHIDNDYDMSTAYSILYLRGDDRLLRQIIDMRTGWFARAVPAPTDRPARMDTLIAGLCQKLGRPLPPGIPKLTDRNMDELRGY